MPADAPVNSAIVAPTTAKVVAIFNAGKMYGKALGNLNLVNICHLEADNDLNKSSASGSMAVKPLTAPTSTGKKATNADITIFCKLSQKKN